MSVSSLSSLSSTAATAASTSASSTSSSAASAQTSYNTFLTLLTTQLTNQNPLDPTDPNQFTNELIQLSGVEQQLQANDYLSQIKDSMASLTSASGVGYVGRTIEYTGASAPLQSGSATWSYDLANAASNVTLSVQDSSGNTVWTGSGDSASGSHDFTWDGKDANGQQLADGAYTLSVSATNASGDAVTATISSHGKVTGADSSNGAIDLMLGTIAVKLADVTSVAS
jgi:flagellar basal-body rod modification protein FlgD